MDEYRPPTVDERWLRLIATGLVVVSYGCGAMSEGSPDVSSGGADGGLVALDDTVSIRDVIRTLLDFNTRESCGKCTPCREGTARLRDMLDGPGAFDHAAIAELSEVVRVASLCGLGQAAPLSLMAALRDYPELA